MEVKFNKEEMLRLIQQYLAIKYFEFLSNDEPDITLGKFKENFFDELRNDVLKKQLI